MPVSTRAYALAAVSVVAIGLVATYAVTRNGTSDRYAACRASNIAGAAAIGGPFTLVDEDGRTVTDKDVLTKPSLVYFGYTFCPDVCPTDTARNAEAIDALEEQGFEVTPVFISVDPDRDTPAVLKEWTDYLHPRMIGLTGSAEQIAAAAKQYRTYYKVPEDKSDEYYLVDHMTQTYLMLPETGFVEFFNREMTAEDMANSVACFLGS
ncbi:SCO family protein [Defluviimonas sp. WL0050]|uniref:SCO family protein n=1 Tax=Albidovulum litorale TaxID=2984134 RepID=A0ABT2ZNG6_9RHOB|nr:SCO family protein [Defluviimonas sp. WL0050]MCV2872602.1 SCO family protein [Defluviimonas sp. WL0050]